MDPLQGAIKVAGSGLGAQSLRMRVIAENIANASTTGQQPGAEPYARKTIGFESALDNADETALVKVSEIGRSRAPFRIEHAPGHPAADAGGNVKLPNVDILVETADMAEANRSYLANLQMIKQSRDLISMTLDLLRT